MTHALHSPSRRWAALLMVVTAAVHVPLVPGHLEEAPYVGVLFIALILVSLVLAGLLLVSDSRSVWAVSGAVALLAILAFLVSRTAGLPEMGDDVGRWTEPLGFPALAAELAAVGLAVTVLRRTPSARS